MLILYLEVGDLLLVDEHLQVAGMGEIDLGGEQRRRLDAVVAGRRHVGEGDGEQRAADAVADRVDAVGAGDLQGDVDRLEDALAHVVLEALRRLPLVGVDPGDDEDRVALVDAPADERFLRR